MATINNSGSGGEESLLGKTGTPVGGVKANLNIDEGPLKKLTDLFGGLQKKIKDVENQLKSLRAEADKAVASLNEAAGGGSGTSTTVTGTKIAQFKNSSNKEFRALSKEWDKMGQNAGNLISGGGPFGKAMGGMLSNSGISPMGMAAATGVGVAGSAVATAMAAIDARVERGRDHALSADRMSVLYQQMTGLSQRQVTQQYRMPLTRYRLGAGGINELLELQSRTGINANQQAASVEAMRTYSGFSMSTAGAANMLENLASAPVANRMFLMGGGGMIGPGGTQRTMQQTLQSLVRTAGLNDERLVKSGMAAGSITRSRLASMGVSGEMQDMVLQYAQQNIQYRKKGGKGMYDASSKDARELMGIEDNFATQAEETERLRNKRDERFYSRQADNFADLEKQTQKLTKVFTELEDKLSGIIGQRTSNRIGMKVAGAALMLGGAVAAGFGAVPLGAVMMGSGVGMMGNSGDPNPDSSYRPIKRGDPVGSGGSSLAASDDQIRVPTGSGKKSLNEVKNMASFKGMHPKMQERLLKMMRANPNVGFGQGFRSVAEQRDMFLSRYERTSEKTKLFWDGSYWKHVSGPPAAPPGMSMHGIGLAADLEGDTNWVVAHAQEFGLQHFGNVNNEKWHVQPAELPAGFGDYMKSGATWGTGQAPITPETVSEGSMMALGAADEHSGGSNSSITSGKSGGGGISYESISSRVAADNFAGGAGQGALAGGSGGANSTHIATSVSSAGLIDGVMAGADVARLLYNQGFRGRDLIKMVAIAQRESHFNPRVHNTNSGSGDNSYGLFQINMLGDMGPERLRALGLSSAEQLFDPVTNVRAAKWLFDQGVKAKNNGFYHWGDYPNSGPGSSDGGIDIAEATKIVTDAKLLGDPMPESGSRAASSQVSVKGGHTYNISVPMSVVSTNNTNHDLQRIAKEVARLIQRELQLDNLRSN